MNVHTWLWRCIITRKMVIGKLITFFLGQFGPIFRGELWIWGRVCKLLLFVLTFLKCAVTNTKCPKTPILTDLQVRPLRGSKCLIFQLGRTTIWRTAPHLATTLGALLSLNLPWIFCNKIYLQTYMGVEPKIVIPQNGWFIRETLLKWMIWA